MWTDGEKIAALLALITPVAVSTHNIMRVISASVRGLWSIHGPDGIFVFRQDSSLPRGLLFQLLLIEHSGVGLSLASRGGG